jgi:hypothetical protein
MTSKSQFSPEVLQNFSALKGFFEGKEAIAQLKKKAKSSDSPFEWDESLMSIYSTFAKTLSGVFHTLSMWDLGQKWLLKSKWAAIRPDSYYRNIFGDRFLVRSVNLPPSDSITLPSAVEVSSIQDFRVRRLLPSNVKRLQFNSEEGGCLGGSEWMLALYFRTQGLFSNTKQHLIALAKLFRKGLPVEAQVLQAFANDVVLESPHLGLTKHVDVRIENKGSFQDRLEKAAAALYAAPPGAYAITLPGHRVTWFKATKTTSYMHCENMGLIEILSVKDYIEACDILLTNHTNVFDPNVMIIKSVKRLVKKDSREHSE